MKSNDNVTERLGMRMLFGEKIFNREIMSVPMIHSHIVTKYGEMTML
jgi:hypothetical protein